MGAQLRAGMETAVTGAVRFRRAREGDLDRIAQVEASSFAQPWRRRTFESLLGRPSVDVVVAESDGRVDGYAVVRSTVGESELANLAVSPARRGAGLGRALLREAVEAARSRGATWIFLAVRASNAGAARLYRRCGFQEIGAQTSYYSEPAEDARLFAMDLFSDGDGA